MPLLESTDYERFRIDEATNPAMTLDEAVKKAREMRSTDSTKANFYRVEPIDQNANAFRVETVPVASVYADFVSRIARIMFRYPGRRRD